MRIAGIDIKGSEARIAVIDTSTNPPSLVAQAPEKIKLVDSDDAANVRAFHQSISRFIASKAIDRIAIRTRMKKGKFAGGPDSFKIEAAIQLCDCEVILVSPQTINKAKLSHDIDPPASLRKYQHDAFDAALAVIDPK